MQNLFTCADGVFTDLDTTVLPCILHMVLQWIHLLIYNAISTYVRMYVGTVKFIIQKERYHLYS